MDKFTMDKPHVSNVGKKHNRHLYVIEGDLTPIVRSDMNKKRIWDFTSAFRVANLISLEHQHDGYDKFDGPLHLDCTFYLAYPGSFYKTHEFNGKYHIARPYLSGLLIFIETVGVDIIFNTSSHIASANIKKLYDSSNPRIEFKFCEIKHPSKEKDE